jgi:hypothetical protein
MPMVVPEAAGPTTLTVASDPGLALPPGQADKARKEWRKILEKLQRGEVGEAMEKLDHFEERFGASEQTQSLRSQLATMPPEAWGERGPGHPEE